MRIAAIHHALPTTRVTNADVFAALERHNPHLSAADRATVRERVAATLAASGTEVRYHLGDGEQPLALIADAGRRALATARRDAAEIEFVIYCGVARGWVEPAMAPAVQTALGLTSATGFDVLDACAGWLRALQIAHGFLRAGTYRCGMIVNGELGLFRHHIGWRVPTLDRLDLRVPGYTIGEAATATVVDATPDDDFQFAFRTHGQHVARCMVPLPGAGDFLPVLNEQQWTGGEFFSDARSLVDAVAAGIDGLWRDHPTLPRRPDIAFGHEVSEKVCDAITRSLGMRDVYVPTHRRFGNTVAASVPLGMSVALEEGRLRRGQQTLVIVGAAGVSVGFGAFTF